MPNVTINESQVIENAIRQVVFGPNGLLQTAQIVNKVNRSQLGYRPLRPTDFTDLAFQAVTGTPAYSWSIAAGTVSILQFTTPSTYAVAFFGLEGASNISSLLPGGYFVILVNTVKKVEVNLADLVNAQSGKIYFFDQTVIVPGQTAVTWQVFNPTTVTQTIGLWPVAYVAGPAENLHVNPVTS